MKAGREFTDQELKEMGTRTLDLVLDAIDAGDRERAKELANRMYREFSYLQDGYAFWIAGLLTYLYENHGIEAVEAAERKAHTIEGKVVFKPLEKTDLRSQVEHLAGALRGHLQPVVITEDEATVRLTMQPCGSGERIIQKGGYEAGLARVAEPHRITWGLPDFPIYCVHCPVLEALQIENTGRLGAGRVISKPLGEGGCQFVFYKDPSAIPEEFYLRIGKSKPPA